MTEKTIDQYNCITIYKYFMIKHSTLVTFKVKYIYHSYIVPSRYKNIIKTYDLLCIVRHLEKNIGCVN